jgi:hypothetical protein
LTRRLTGGPWLPATIILGTLFGSLALSGWVTFALWRQVGLPLGVFEFGLAGHPPDPYAWPRVYAVWLPVAYGLFTVLHLGLARSGRCPRTYLRLDILTYAFLPGFLLLELLWRELSDWRLWFGFYYLLVVALKTGFLLRGLFVAFVAAPRTADAEPRQLARYLFATAGTAYLLTAAYLVAAISTTGDEPYYLLVTHSLVADGDLDLANNFAARDYYPFYWGRLYSGQNTVVTASGAIYSTTYSGLLAYLMVPGYALGGRLGATVTISVLAAVLMVNVFLLAWEATGVVRVAFRVWLCLAFVSPVLFFSSQLYPEIPAAAVAAYAIRRIRRLPDTLRHHLPALGVCLVALPLLKVRYTLLALPLLAWALWRVRRSTAVFPVLAGAGLLGLGLVLLDRYRLGGILYARYYGHIPLRELFAPSRQMTQALVGILFDQEFGLLLYSPIYLLAFLGIPLALRRSRDSVVLLLMAAFYVYPFLQMPGWYGGFSLPFRYFICIVPILGLCTAYALDRTRGLAMSTVAATCWIWSVLVAFWLTLNPILRYNQGDGEAAWIKVLGQKLSVSLPRLFPSLVNPSPETAWLVAALGATILAGMGWLFVTDRHGDPVGQREPASPALTGVLSLGLLLAVGALMTVAAKGMPTIQIEGETMEKSGNGVFFPGDFRLPLKAWVMRSSGTLSNVVRLREGPATLTVSAGGYSTDSEMPGLVVRLDGQTVGKVDVVAGRGEWKTGAYPFAINPSAGEHRLTLEFTNGVDDRAQGRVRHLLVDKVRIEKRR